MRTADEIIADIGAATRITRDQRLIALLVEIKQYLETPHPSPPDLPSRPAEPLPKRDLQINKNRYMRDYMRDYRKGVRRQKPSSVQEEE